MRRTVIAAMLVLVVAAPSGAHEIGKTQATVVVPGDGSYHVDIVVDPDALLTKLEVFSGAEASSPSSKTERDRRIERLASVFLDRVSVSFDGIREAVRFEYLPVSAISDLAQMPSIVRLAGQVPAGASALTFANGLAMGTYALNVRRGESPQQTFWLDGGNSSPAVSLLALPPPSTPGDIAAQYFGLGYTHILPKGLDHILFVIGIFLLSTRWRSILLQVSTFTVAHSITLGLTMYGVVSLPARIVEPMIALSIAYVAIENLVTTELKPWRLALVFGFGLLHGMGFAGVLRDLGLPRSQYLTALVSFNGGVEAGQLSVILIAFAVVAYWRSDRAVYRRFVVQPASLAMALTGLYWMVQRVVTI